MENKKEKFAFKFLTDLQFYNEDKLGHSFKRKQFHVNETGGYAITRISIPNIWKNIWDVQITPESVTTKGVLKVTAESNFSFDDRITIDSPFIHELYFYNDFHEQLGHESFGMHLEDGKTQEFKFNIPKSTYYINIIIDKEKGKYITTEAYFEKNKTVINPFSKFNKKNSLVGSFMENYESYQTLGKLFHSVVVSDSFFKYFNSDDERVIQADTVKTPECNTRAKPTSQTENITRPKCSGNSNTCCINRMITDVNDLCKSFYRVFCIDDSHDAFFQDTYKPDEPPVVAPKPKENTVACNCKNGKCLSHTQQNETVEQEDSDSDEDETEYAVAQEPATQQES